ncbi:MAG: DUF2442 domain-containing protein [Helicobacteraceae bacterium]|nr:DUF2442 domain-containing protein [Helicobacteraceae bacterium]
MYIEVVEAKFIKDKEIFIVFNDGNSGVVDFNIFIKKGGVFKGFSDQKLFEHFKIDTDFGTLVWSDTLDIAPETLYRNIA